jgi:tRNA nucleotidyltransferase (CCA-adding enzyme)
MKEYLVRLPRDIKELISVAGTAAGRLEVNAYLVGGFVRDILLGVPNLDVDIVVEGDGIAFAEHFARRLNGTVTRHRRFGTATVHLPGHLKVDVATARKETYPSPGCLPVVSPGTIQDDLFRRDFTVNALAVAISDHAYGVLLDLFGGRQDLEEKVLRILHPLSFIDDPTRIIRGIRFEQRFGFSFERETLKLLRSAVSDGVVCSVQPQRIREEVILLLSEKDPLRCIVRLEKLVGLSCIIPGLKLTRRRELLLKAVPSAVSWFLSLDPGHRQIDTWLIYLMAMVDGLDPVRVGHLCGRFAFRKSEAKRLMSYVRDVPGALKAIRSRTVKPSELYHTLEPLSREVIIMLYAHAGTVCARKNLELFLRKYHGEAITVSGHDIAGMGVAPGPDFQKVLKDVLDAKLDGLVDSHQTQIDFARKAAQKLARAKNSGRGGPADRRRFK